jgi:outer membrane protein OmpA-like peptidoglycan-associated protein
MRKSNIIVTCSTAISLALCAPHAHAQTVTPPPAPALADAPPAAASPAAAPTAKPGRAVDNYFEVGVFGGALWLSDNHALETRNHQPFKAQGELGARAAYFPFAFLGAELEGVAGGGKTQSGDPSDVWAVRGHALVQLPGNIVVPFALIGGGVLGAGSNVTGSDSDKLFEFGAGAKLSLDDFLGARVDLRDNLTQKYHASAGAQAHSPELLFGLTFTLDPVTHTPPKVVPPPDADGDGVLDADDKCPKEAGVAPDGCPPPKDSDGDGVLDERDACPNEAGPAPTGCPDRDPDHDCVPVPLDKCPDVPGLPTDGCPDPDPDHDGIVGDKDKCPTQPETVNGFEDDDGCPDTLPEKIKKYSGVVPGIEFDLAKATIRPSSRPTLDEAAGVLKEYPALRISISGHTDDVGDHNKNVDLSKARADSVKAYFVAQGIDAARIETRGAGPDEPIADNKQAAGRQKNRRIEFKLLQ